MAPKIFLKIRLCQLHVPAKHCYQSTELYAVKIQTHAIWSDKQILHNWGKRIELIRILRAVVGKTMTYYVR